MSVLEELKEELCKTMKILYDQNLLTDLGGNISIRDPTDKSIWITPRAMQKNAVEPHHLVKLSLNGKILKDSKGRGPSVEYPMHLNIANKIHTNVILHTHPPYATAYSLLENPPPIPLITEELAMLIPEILLVPFAPSGSLQLGKNVVEALHKSKIVILENHGVVAIGEKIQETVLKTRALEEVFHKFLLAKHFGGEIRPLP